MSAYRRDRKRHSLPIQLERGAFDFARRDKVIIERPRRKKDGWHEVGLLDVEMSTPTMAIIDASNRPTFDSSTPIIREGDRLRFKSLMETYSRTRRETATTRILERRSIIPNLVDFFDGRSEPCVSSQSISANRAEIEELYQLNRSQADAFVDLLGVRPVGFLQGPPGTGKTKFIGSFIHYALSRGLARNVLLASQSHEAVNNAGEAVLKLFRQSGNEPSLVRVGQEGSVSDDLRPFQAERVEAQFKDRFKAKLGDRLKLLGERLGLGPELTEKLIIAETALLPVIERLRAVCEIGPHATARANGLAETAATIAAKIGLTAFGSEEWRSEAAYADLIGELAHRHGASERQVGRLRDVAKLARDWSGSISTHQRSFETFLAGTRSIVAGTCVGLGRSALGLTDTRFDLAVIDEAARCTASELAVPMQSAKWILLVGDHRQLEPHHRPDVISTVQMRNRVPEREILRSDFDRAFSSAYGQRAGRTLTAQYRMLPPIGRVVSAAFYGGQLTHGRTSPIIPSSLRLEDLDHPLTWIETDDLGAGAYQQRTEGRSLTNDSEADAIVGLLRRLGVQEGVRDWLRRQKEHRRPIGIICTYAAQRDLIKRRLVASGLDSVVRDACKVDTVDSYQGKENLIVILSLVRNNADGAIENGAATIRPGFMQRPNRICVAVSRAMDRLVIVGSRRRWQLGTPMAGVSEAFSCEHASGNARVIAATDVANEAPPKPKSKVQRGRKVSKGTK